MTDTAERDVIDRGPKRVKNLTQLVVEGILSQVKSGALRVGDKLPKEAEIVQSYDVSRTVVREALSRLQAAGFLETRHGIGTFVINRVVGAGLRMDSATIVTAQDVLALLELRISVESESAALAAERRSASDLRQLEQHLAEFNDDTKRGGAGVTADYKFHLQIATATHNKYFVDFMSRLDTMVIPRTRLDTPILIEDEREKYYKLIAKEHEAIFQAIKEQNKAQAKMLMLAHLESGRERLRLATQSVTEF
jgi:GntR family transcriptional regulator, transcriptional repressor for pyruvate dehydrogenase complex